MKHPNEESLDAAFWHFESLCRDKERSPQISDRAAFKMAVRNMLTGSDTACGHEGTMNTRTIRFNNEEILVSQCYRCGDRAYKASGYRWTNSLKEFLGDDL